MPSIPVVSVFPLNVQRVLLGLVLFSLAACAKVGTLTIATESITPVAALPTPSLSPFSTLVLEPIASPTLNPTAIAGPSPTVQSFPIAAVPDPKSAALVSHPGRVSILTRPTKISQIIGDYDAEMHQPTLSKTLSRFGLESTDLGIPFTHKGLTYLLFGDSFGNNGGDAIGYSSDHMLDDGLTLDLVRDTRGAYKPITIPGIKQDAFEVPTEGVSIDGNMYIYHTTDASNGPNGQVMGRSVVAVSTDDGQSFRYLYDLSRLHFINVSVVKANAPDWRGLPGKDGEALVMFGSGDYRRSDVFLASQSTSQIGSRSALRFWSGFDPSGIPIWSQTESDSRPLFSQPCVGEFSVSFNRYVRKWIMIYNCSNPRGINLRTSDQPWGPWTDPIVLFDPWSDGGYCHFIHVSWSFRKCDSVQGPGQDQVWGGEYGSYQFKDLATGTASSTTIYFTLSTWNPYTVVLMKSTLQLIQ